MVILLLSLSPRDCTINSNNSNYQNSSFGIFFFLFFLLESFLLGNGIFQASLLNSHKTIKISSMIKQPKID